MDLEKVVKFVEKYVRDYVFYIISILSNPGKTVGSDGTADRVLKAEDGRIWVFCVISVGIGYFAFSSAAKGSIYDPSVPITSILFTVWLWVLFSVVAYFAALVFDGTGTLLETLSVCLRIFPTVYVVSALSTLTFSYFGLAWIDKSEVSELTYPLFLVVQFILLSIYLPAGLRRVHDINFIGHVGLTLTLPVIVLFLNMMASGFIENGLLNWRSKGGRMPPMAPPPLSGSITPPITPYLRSQYPVSAIVPKGHGHTERSTVP